jgi:hypothetical protein|tara:strand:+ start:255 stop:983 length:729 start_codon:yes stop_codon:yes gene_type:complete
MSQVEEKNEVDFSAIFAGDVVQLKVNGQDQYAEVLSINEDGNMDVSCIRATAKQGGRIWEFVADNEWEAVSPSDIIKHAPVGEATRDNVRNAWKSIGFYPGGDGISFCRVSDEDRVTLPLYQGDENESDDEDDPDGFVPSTDPSMRGYAVDGFVVPDDEGDDFTFANPDELEGEAADFVRDTHRAVHDFEKWNPTDKKARAIKNYIDGVSQKVSLETDNKRFAGGKSSISTTKPPLGKKRKR